MQNSRSFNFKKVPNNGHKIPHVLPCITFFCYERLQSYQQEIWRNIFTQFMKATKITNVTIVSNNFLKQQHWRSTSGNSQSQKLKSLAQLRICTYMKDTRIQMWNCIRKLKAYLRQPLPVCVQDIANGFFHSHKEPQHKEIHQKVLKIWKLSNKTCLRIIKHGTLSLSVVERIVYIFSLKMFFDQSGPSFYFCWRLLLFWGKNVNNSLNYWELERFVFRHVLFDNFKKFRIFWWFCW